MNGSNNSRDNGNYNGNRNFPSHPMRTFRRSPYAVLNLPENNSLASGLASESASDSLHSRRTSRNEKTNTVKGRKVSEEEIRDAYKRLSRLFHPDKRPPGKEREDAQEMFIELMNAYEILGDPVLRQAYDQFGHSAVSLVRHHRYNTKSLYRKLSRLHERGRSSQALELLQSIIGDSKWRQKQKEWQLHADVNLSMNASGILTNAPGGDDLDADWPEVSATNVSLTALVPMPPPNAASAPASHSSHDYRANHQNNDNQRKHSRRDQRVQLSIGGQSSLQNGLGSTHGILSASYRPVPHTDVSGEFTFGTNHFETSLSSTQHMASGTRMAERMSHQREKVKGKGGRINLGFSSHRSLTLFRHRTLDATFSLGMGSNFNLHYGILSLSTVGFFANAQKEGQDDDDDDGEDDDSDADSDDNSHTENDNNHHHTNSQSPKQNNSTNVPNRPPLPPPTISAKIGIGSQFPIEITIDQSRLFHSSHRSGKLSVGWSPLQGYRWKGWLSREISALWITGYAQSEKNKEEDNVPSTLGIGIEHTGRTGLTWLLQYHRPEGITLRIPIFVTSFLSPGYWNQVLWISMLSLLMDETVGELAGQSISDRPNIHETYQNIGRKLDINEMQQTWWSSDYARQDAERQRYLMEPIADIKRRHEEAVDGLVIIKATYSLSLVPSPSSSLRDSKLDVTQQLQYWIEKSSLRLPATSKSLLLGFYNLCQVSRSYSISPGNEKVHGGKESSFSELIQKWIDFAEHWYTRIFVDSKTSHSRKDSKDNNCFSGSSIDGDMAEHLNAVVELNVRYKYKGNVYEIAVGDEEALNLPSDSALKLGPSDYIS